MLTIVAVRLLWRSRPRKKHLPARGSVIQAPVGSDSHFDPNFRFQKSIAVQTDGD
jgi:hypothetical protein